MTARPARGYALILAVIALVVLAALSIPGYRKVAGGSSAGAPGATGSGAAAQIDQASVVAAEGAGAAFGRQVVALAGLDEASPRLAPYIEATEVPAGYRRVGGLVPAPGTNPTVVVALSADTTLDDGEYCAVVALPAEAGGAAVSVGGVGADGSC